MRSKRGSAAAGIIVSVLIIASIAAIGYYQFGIAPYISVSTTTTTVPSNIRTVRLNITVGAATKTTDAYAPNPIRLVIGVNNSVIWHNADIQGGVGISHSATARTMVNGRPAFDTGVFGAGETSQPIVITTPGTYNYYCVVHPTTMAGTIVVVASK